MEEMIEKEITVLVAKSDEERFDQLVEGFKQFNLNGYTTSEGFDYKAKRVETAIEYRRQEANKYLSQYKEIYINLKMHLSNCCDYQVKENTDICGKCGEHCETTLK